MAKERRKHRRASLELPLDMRSPEGEHKSFAAKTINLSAGGFYCRIRGGDTIYPFSFRIFFKKSHYFRSVTSDDRRRDFLKQFSR